MPQNDFKALANGVGANVLTQTDFAALTSILANGLSSGVVASNLFNKLHRQSTTIANLIAQYICDLSGLDALDDGNNATLLSRFKTAIAAQIDAQSGNYALDTGTANAKAVAVSPAITSYTDGYVVRFKNLVLNTGAVTLSLSGLSAASLCNDVGGALVAGDLPVGAICTAVYDAATSKFWLTTLVPSQAMSQAAADARYAALQAAGQIQPLTVTVSGNALTATLAPTVLDFRSPTLSNGTPNKRTISSNISVTVSSGSTLGTVAATQARIAVLAIDTGSAQELAVVNLAGGAYLDETGLISTTAEGGAGAADSANVIYSTTARTNVPYRVVGFFDITEATPGTWATAPTTVQGTGGQALASGAGGQLWRAVSRVAVTTYYNTTGRPIDVNAQLSSNANSTAICVITQNGVSVTVRGSSGTAGGGIAVYARIPPGAAYYFNTDVGTATVNTAAESY